jgi:hypothetical protein
MRYELTDDEWAAIRPMLPNKPRGVPGTNSPDQKLDLKQIQNYWYHWYMALDRGANLVREERAAFTRHIWRIWNPNWPISNVEFAETASAFDNADWADVVLHSYCVRWGLAPRDPACEPLSLGGHLRNEAKIEERACSSLHSCATRPLLAPIQSRVCP